MSRRAAPAPGPPGPGAPAFERLAVALGQALWSHASLVLVAATLLSALCLWPLRTLRLEGGLFDLLPAGSPEVQAFRHQVQAFGNDRSLVVLVEPAGPPPRGDGERARPAAVDDCADTLAVVARDSRHVASAVERIDPRELLRLGDPVGRLLALAPDALRERLTPEALKKQARRVRKRLADPMGGAYARPLLERDPLELTLLLGDRFRGSLRNLDMDSGALVSPDGQARVVLIETREPASQLPTSRALVDRLTQASRGPQAAPSCQKVKVGLVGAAPYTVAYALRIRRDLIVSSVLSLLAVLALALYFLRDLRVVVVAAPPLAAGQLWTLALLSLSSGGLSALAVAFGAIVIGLGIDTAVHAYDDLRRGLAGALPPGEDPAAAGRLERAREVFVRSYARTLGAVLVAGLTTAAVFLAFSMAAFPALAQLGLLGGVGLLMNLVAMHLVMPAALAVLVRHRLPRRAGSPLAEPRRVPALGRMGTWIAGHARTVLVAAGIVTLALGILLGLLGPPRLTDRLVPEEGAGFAPADDEARMRQRFGLPTDRLIAVFRDRDVESAVARAEPVAAFGQSLVRGRTGLLLDAPDPLITSRQAYLRGERQLAERLPAAARELGELLAAEGLRPERFERALAQLARPRQPPGPDPAALPPTARFLARRSVARTPEGATVVVVVHAPASELAALAAELGPRVEKQGGVLTGPTLLGRMLRRDLERDLVRGTVLSAAAVLLLLGLHLLGGRQGAQGGGPPSTAPGPLPPGRLRSLAAIVLPLLGVAVVYAALLRFAGLGGGGLLAQNLIVIPFLIGYGIDDHVYLVHAHGRAPELGLAGALEHEGPPMLLTGMSAVAGFAALLSAADPGLRILGTAGVAGTLVCLAGALVLAPAILAVGRRP